MLNHSLMRRSLIVSMLVGVMAVPFGTSLAAGQGQTQAEQQIYGSQMMTQQERLEYRARMRAARTVEEREKLRLEHHEQMRERARERGLSLPEQPVPGGAGMGPGGGMGSGGGMGPGGGMGQGGGMGPRR